MREFTHFNKQGRARMVDISGKKETERTAKARSSIFLSETVYEKITKQDVEKGDVLSVAQVAGIMAAKNTSQMIPMCHPLQLKSTDISFIWERHNKDYELIIDVLVKTKGRTGVEMEALTAASITALTVYDMCKSFGKDMIIGETYLLEKTGGKSGDYLRS